MIFFMILDIVIFILPKKRALTLLMRMLLEIVIDINIHSTVQKKVFNEIYIQSETSLSLSQILLAFFYLVY